MSLNFCLEVEDRKQRYSFKYMNYVASLFAFCLNYSCICCRTVLLCAAWSNSRDGSFEKGDGDCEYGIRFGRETGGCYWASCWRGRSYCYCLFVVASFYVGQLLSPSVHLSVCPSVHPSVSWVYIAPNTSSAEVRQRTSQAFLTSSIQSRHLCLFLHRARMDDHLDSQFYVSISLSHCWYIWSHVYLENAKKLDW